MKYVRAILKRFGTREITKRKTCRNGIQHFNNKLKSKPSKSIRSPRIDKAIRKIRLMYFEYDKK